MTGLLTRAYIANPHLNRDDLVNLLFATTDKAGHCSTGNKNDDAFIYGQAFINARRFLLAAYKLNLEKQGNRPSSFLSQLKASPHQKFLAPSKSLRHYLDLLNIIEEYEDSDHADERKLKGLYQKLSRNFPFNIKKLRETPLRRSDFPSLSEIFKQKKISEANFTQFVLKKFPLKSLSENGSSLMADAIGYERPHLYKTLKTRKFSPLFRGKSREGEFGPLPIHAAAFQGNLKIFIDLVKQNSPLTAELNVHSNPLDFTLDPFLLTVFGSLNREYSRIEERIKILNFMYKRGYDFKRKVSQTSLEDYYPEFNPKLVQALKSILAKPKITPKKTASKVFSKSRRVSATKGRLRFRKTPAVKVRPKLRRAPAVKARPKLRRGSAAKGRLRFRKAPAVKARPRFRKAPVVKVRPKFRRAPVIKVRPKVRRISTAKARPKFRRISTAKVRPKVKRVPAVKARPRHRKASLSPPKIRRKQNQQR